MEFSKEQLEYLEELFWLPCCHVTGEHSPTHFQERKYICMRQMRDAFKRGCEALGINPQVKSKSDCYWCNNYPDKKEGEGLRLFHSSTPLSSPEVKQT